MQAPGHCVQAASAALLVVHLGLAHGQAIPASVPAPAEAAGTRHPWQASAPTIDAEAYFTNLKDGDRIETPYLLKFGLSGGWGLAPISQAARARSGHHHLLVNHELPLDFKKALPFTDQYIHFGKGQMEHVLTLEPGTYKLRMLLADQQHLPHFVFSKPATITVTKKNPTDPKSLQVKGVSLILPGGTAAKPPVRVQFHASALSVAHVSQRIPESGHFRLTVKPAAGGAPAVLDFAEGQTETWLAPPAGGYSLQLELIDNVDASKRLAPTAVARLDVR